MYKLTDLYKQIKEEAAEAQPSQYKIYCDMDGVICDFDKQFEQFGNMSARAYETKFGTDKFWELIDKVGVDFWSQIPWMPEGKQLWSYIEKYKPVLLSSPSRSYSSRYGKKLWVKENLSGSKLILAKRENKRDYANRKSILIDDRTDNINDWNTAGGIGILFTSTNQTIDKLKELGL